jgi:ABC-2 type transport system ATP-binding protein
MPQTIELAKNLQRSDEATSALQLSGVGVRYRLLTDRSRTLKGRLLSALSSQPAEAEFWALRNVDLAVESGQVLGIVGANGSGKSTMLRVISRIIEPAEGSVRTTGRVTPILDLTSTLNPEFSGRDNAFLFGALHGVTRALVEDWIPRIIEFTELGPFFDVPLKAYSSGMIARLAFALSTQLSPDILLLDEVLSVGDEQFQRKSYFRVRKLIDKGNLVLIVSHNLAMLEQICNRMILLGGGTIVADGTPAKVVAEYRRRVDRQ